MQYSQLTLDVVIKARELVAKGWTQNTYARDIDGQRTIMLSNQASFYCASGALLKATKQVCDTLRSPWNFEELFRYCGFPECFVLTLWNDAPGRTQAEVLEAFDKVIAGLKTELGVSP